MNIDKNRYLNPSSLQAGDVLLCFDPGSVNKHPLIKNGYTHVAICTNGSEILDATPPKVRLTDVSELLKYYKYIAVKRSDGWTVPRVKALNVFAKTSLGKEFNRTGIGKFEKRLKAHSVNSLLRLHKYFTGQYTPRGPLYGTYFCSQLVNSAFCWCRFIDLSASIAFDSKITSPQKIFDDCLYGYFIGFIVSDGDNVPENDPVWTLFMTQRITTKPTIPHSSVRRV